jgi:hypothetical protein
VALVATAACRGTLSPLSNKLEVGEEPYLAFAADGEAGAGDLFASALVGGTPYQVTFTRLDERLPALSPDGVMLAFVRARAVGGTGAADLVVMNLLNGAERRRRLALAGGADALAWSPDGATLYARRGDAIFTMPAPPAEGELAPVPPAAALAADSAFRVLLGQPPVGEAMPCPDGPGVCARLGTAPPVVLSPVAAFPIRWLGDSIAYLERGEWTIRPLGGGATRILRWTRPVANPRSVSVFGGR